MDYGNRIMVKTAFCLTLGSRLNLPALPADYGNNRSAFQLLEKTGLDVGAISLWEVNEAFSGERGIIFMYSYAYLVVI